MMIIPTSWKVGAVLLMAGALFAADAYRVHRADQRGFDRSTSERAARDASALFHRLQDNAAVAAENTDINKFLTKDHDEKLAPVITRIVTERVRVGTGICGPAPTAQAEDAGSGDDADSRGRLVRPDIERDLVALKLAVEKDLATGRACQAFGRKHGFIE